jgi:hypothetical protein
MGSVKNGGETIFVSPYLPTNLYDPDRQEPSEIISDNWRKVPEGSSE